MTPDDGQRNCPKHVEFYSKSKLEKLVHLVGFIIRIYHDARSPERQIRKSQAGKGNIFIGTLTKNCTKSTRHFDITKFVEKIVHDIYHCCVYSDELLMMDRRTARNM